MIKVLHFVSTPAIWSGVMSVIMNYYRHMDRSRIQFDFLCFLPCKSREESYEGEIEELGGRVYFTPKPASLSAVRELDRFFQENARQYVWLHNHEVYLSVLLRPLASRHGLKNFIVHSHATRYSDRPLAAFRNRILCFPIPFMKCEHFACSQAAGIFLYKKRLHRHCAFHLMPNAIDKHRFQYNSALREEYRRQFSLEENFVLGHVGRFVPQKNHLYLLNVFSRIQKELPKARLLLVGDGPLAEDMKRASSSLRLENKVLFLGKRDDISCLLQAMDMFVLPSIYEGLPVSCLEAQAAGLPCLISDAVSDEVCFDDLVIRLPLDAPDLWVQKCITFANKDKYVPEKRERHSPDHLPDIVPEAQKLADFYMLHKA